MDPATYVDIHGNNILNAFLKLDYDSVEVLHKILEIPGLDINFRAAYDRTCLHNLVRGYTYNKHLFA